MGSLDSASLGTSSLEGVDLAQISDILKIGITAVSLITAISSLS